MSNSIFCPNCGMLKSNCTCGNYSKKESKGSRKESKGPTNLFSFSPSFTIFLFISFKYSLSGTIPSLTKKSLFPIG